MRIYYHGSHKNLHGLGYVLDYKEDPRYIGNYTLKMDSGHTLMYARRESFDLLEDDNDSISEYSERSDFASCG